MQRQARQRLQALLLRNEIRYVGRSSWTRAHRRWISKVKLPNPTQQIAFEVLDFVFGCVGTRAFSARVGADRVQGTGGGV